MSHFFSKLQPDVEGIYLDRNFILLSLFIYDGSGEYKLIDRIPRKVFLIFEKPHSHLIFVPFCHFTGTCPNHPVGAINQSARIFDEIILPK